MHYLANSEQEVISRETEVKKAPKEGEIHKKKIVKLEDKIKKYNGKITNYINKLRHRQHIMNFYETYAENPLKFIQNFMLQQNGLIKLLKDEEQIKTQALTDDVESSHFYTENKALVEGEIEKYLANSEANEKKETPILQKP